MDKLIIKNAYANNLKNIDITLPKNQLIVITGVSGSGKSSLAFDTIYTEGKRRYFESLSSYARQFLGGNEKADVESIDGLSPTIAVDQKTISHNPRSTVGTSTEIYDYLRVLYARAGQVHCLNNHGMIYAQTKKEIMAYIQAFPVDTKIEVLAPVDLQHYRSHKEVLSYLLDENFVRVYLDNQLTLVKDIDVLDSKIKNIHIVIDRIILDNEDPTRNRISESIDFALKTTNQRVVIKNNDNYKLFSTVAICTICSFSMGKIEPNLFSFNSPHGACETCKGLGYNFVPDENKMIPDPNLSINQGGLDFFKNTVNTTNMDWQRFACLIKHYKIDKSVPIKNLKPQERKYLLYGSDEPINIDLLSVNKRAHTSVDYVEGVLELIKRRYEETNSEQAREHYNKYMSEKTCKQCHGKKLCKQALSVKINNFDIIDFTYLNVNQAIDFFLQWELNDEQKQIALPLIKEITDRLGFLKNVGLDYLDLARSSSSLSGGESQRIRLATQMGSKLTGILYVLDEPSIGLHQKDNDKLIDTLKEMRDLGNTVIVVEHDLDTIKAADYVVDMGPKAGVHGGYVIAQGTVQEVRDNPNSITGQYLNHTLSIPVPTQRRGGNGSKIILKKASSNNLKDVDLTIPLGKLIAVTGVSGSGKSTLIMETLVKALEYHNFNPFVTPGKYKSLVGNKHIDKLVLVNQDPIGRTTRSNPATYVGVFDDIRTVFENTKLAKEKGFLKGRFSFNVPGGRCEKCMGDGTIRIAMHFLPDVYIECDECDGQRYNQETLDVKFKQKSIYDVLQMSVEEALEFFINFPIIHRKLQLLMDVGLGYISLGASSTSLSGGEAQRIKLAKFLQRKPTGKTLYVLDEPTTGLHLHDIAQLVKIFNRIVDNNDTIIVIEHNLDLIKVCDHIIDMGPDGGDQGGTIVATGTPEQIVMNAPHSYTAQYLKPYLEGK
ncbi:excinuclease ABC subunit UvrA [Ureaplasma miroungigenitalium]|uniref:UvrABC system protein A n=1 Tax=Ureaplasma miroungigenitalium TaxID=1042321 RepID=A0ABT3BN65_9BACT|nr:excinuclease ABC subunit UvrA [Ureaplasma miroungigenitalium]MCV3728684.1 excinuclease ABC subunit UvrA [Ureaplasma miroungigenitalium]MCV3734375.1 excinuclease ABC subunit UvrA [Ureaplasma miroungigenitalium]